MFLLTIFLAIRLLVRKISRTVEEEYWQSRYQKFSKLVDEIVAGIPTKDLIQIKKQPGDKKVLQVLLEKKLLYIKGEDRARVVDQLKELGFVNLYISELESSSPTERATALQVLGDLRITEASGNFTEAIEDPDGDVRLTAVRGLANMVDEITASGGNGTRTGPIIETIVGLLDKPERVPGRRLAEVILDIGSGAVPPLLVATQSANTRTRALAADILGQIGDWRGVDTLIEMLNDPETDVRTQAAGALGSTGDTRAV
ncbi:MAG: HEAT repeat domain-containing protein, partial [Actinomycetia bacterium]|nr:HEAT repeat domain-containing protein [Actinomycetes bacterium]